MPKEPHTVVKKHKVRSFFSAVSAIAGIYLILSSISVIWLNRTLTNTPTYVDTVAPLVTKPAIQKYIAQEVTTAILKNSPTQNLASALLPTSEAASNLNVNQLNDLMRPIIEADAVKIVQSPSFASLWRNTNETAHAAFISQLNNNSGEIDLNLSPAITGLINELNTSQLSALAGHISVTPNTGKIAIKSNNIVQAHHYYRLYEASTYGVVIAAAIAIGLAILLSSKRAQLARRILLWTGILALFQASVLSTPSFLSFSGNNVITKDAVKAFAQAIFHNLLIANLVIGIICVAAGAGSMIYIHLKKHKKV
jgi:hypothetical protein